MGGSGSDQALRLAAQLALALGISFLSAQLIVQFREPLRRLIAGKSAAANIEKALGRKIPPLTSHEADIARACLDMASDENDEADDSPFDRIGGNADAKARLRALVVLPHERPELYASSKLLRGTSGVLLHGPPGTGKTMLVRAVARELGVPFLCVRASALRSMWFGESEKMVSAVFSLAAKVSPCVLFFDEIDGLLTSRGSRGPGGAAAGSSEHLTGGMLSELLSVWDGTLCRAGAPPVTVIAASNRPNAIDAAIHRRLPRQVEVPLPDLADREEILAVILSGDSCVNWSDIDLGAIARKTEGFSGSDLAELCRVAASECMARVITGGASPSEESRALEGGILTTRDILEAMKTVQASVVASRTHRSWVA